MMKVLMYGWEFPPRISGGLGVACHAIVTELAKSGVELTLVLPKATPTENIANVTFLNCKQGARETPEGFSGRVHIKHPQITTHLYPYARTADYKNLLSEETLQDFLLLLNQLELPVELKAMARSIVAAYAGGIDVNAKYEINLLTEVFRYALFAGSLALDIEHEVIHAHDWLTILAALEARRRSHKPLVLHIHALETDRSGLWVDQRIFAIEKYGMEQADHIIAVSQYTKNKIIEHYGISPDKITVVHNGIYLNEQTQRSPNHDHPPMVLFLGRITQQKGPYFFIEVAKKVLAKKPDVQFVLAGTGDLLIDMIEHVAGLRIGKNVHFTGFLNGSQVQDIFRLADVYVMPSVSEPFGLSALEAIANDVPAIISKQSGVKEVLNHVLVADFWDIDEMAAKILALLEYRPLGQVTVANAHHDLAGATWHKAAEKITHVYKHLISG